MRRAILSTCVQSYGACAQTCTHLNNLQQGCAAPVLAAHTQANGVIPGRHTSVPSTPPQAGADSPKTSGKQKPNRWRIVVRVVRNLLSQGGGVYYRLHGELQRATGELRCMYVG